MTQVLDEIDKMGLDDMGNVTGIQEMDRRLGECKVMFDLDKSKRKPWEMLRLEAPKGMVNMMPKGGEKIGVPVEYPTEMITEYVKKYVTDLRVSKDMIPGRRTIYNRTLMVKFNRIRDEMSGRIWVGPGISAVVKRNNLCTMAEWRPQCTNCLEYGHLCMNCTQEQRCIKCKQVGYMGKNCAWCPWCCRFRNQLDDCALFKEAVRKREERESV